MNQTLASALAIALAGLTTGSATAQEAEPRRPSLETLERIIETREPEIRVAVPEQARLTARRIDIVDEDGTIRMTLAAETRRPSSTASSTAAPSTSRVSSFTTRTAASAAASASPTSTAAWRCWRSTTRPWTPSAGACPRTGR